MKRFHRDHEINVTRERALGGHVNVYYSVFRESDGFECTSGYYDASRSVVSVMQEMIQLIDDELQGSHPWAD